MTDPKSSSTEGYHFFLIPEGELREHLEATIRELAMAYGGPVFIPHVTVLPHIVGVSEEQLKEAGRRIAAHHTPFTLTLGDVAYEDAYFRALYMKVEEQPDLERLHDELCIATAEKINRAYEPHVSLLYGNYTLEKKEHLRSSLSMPLGQNFLVNTLHLYKTPGEVSTWELVDSFPFMNS